MPNPEERTPRKKLKEKVSALRMEKRVGKYTHDPDNISRGIFLAPKEEQREFKKNLKQKIREVRSER